jgi:rhodanese-related sulfurtransferase
MQTKSLDILLEEANKQIKRLSFKEALEMLKNTNTIIIDVREESEVMTLGVIKNAIHIPRGLIEFKLSPNSPNNPNGIDQNTNLLIYCAGGYRSALAAKTLSDVGFKNVYNIGGFQEWIDNGGDIQASP